MEVWAPTAVGQPGCAGRGTWWVASLHVALAGKQYPWVMNPAKLTTPVFYALIATTHTGTHLAGEGAGGGEQKSASERPRSTNQLPLVYAADPSVQHIRLPDCLCN